MKTPHARFAALIVATLVAACGAPEAQDRALAFEPVLLGQTETRGILAPQGSAQVRVSGSAELSALLSQDASRVDVSFSPTLPVPASAEVELLNTHGQVLSRIRVRGAGRAPELRVVPSSVQLATSVGVRYAQASLWVWPESDVSVQVADTQWPPCPAPGACVRVQAERAQRGLPAALSLEVDGAAQVPPTITLRSCDHPGCAVTVEVHAPTASGALRCSPSVLELPAAAVGALTSVVLRCEGEPWTATSLHPEVSVIMTSSTTAQVEWVPQAAGPLTTMIDLGGSHTPVPLRGYALDAPDCALVLTPQRVSFGQVAVNATAQGRLSLSNIGNSDCLVADVQAQPAGQFSVGAALPQWLASGQHLELQAQFTPHRAGTHQGRAEVQAATATALVADLEGQGVQASLRLDPPVLELGSLAQCGLQTVPIVIVNEGGAPGLVTGIEVSTQGPVQVRFSVGLPVTIPAGDSFSLLALVEAQGPGPVGAQVRIELDQGGTPAWTEAQLNATVAPLPTQEDEFEQLALPQVDVLLVVDDGPGFAQEQAYLESSLGELASNPTWSNVDARFGVMAASLADPNRAGRLIPEDEPSLQVISSTVAEVRRDAVRDLVRRVGTANSTRSEGLQAILQTLSEPGGDGQTRFLRPEAQLSILVVTTRDDNSAGSVADYVFGLQQSLGPRSSHRLHVSTIAGPLPSGCTDGNLQAAAAPRYRQVAQQTGGLNLSICDRRWPAYLIPRNVRFGFKSRFFLSEAALEPTIEVYVQGERIPQYSPSGTNNWAYDAATNSVNFSPFAVPEPSAQIRVRYQVACP